MNWKDQFGVLLDRVNHRKTPRRELVLLGIVLALIAAFWATGFILREWSKP